LLPEYELEISGVARPPERYGAREKLGFDEAWSANAPGAEAPTPIAV
jgi:hypothetical protein